MKLNQPTLYTDAKREEAEAQFLQAYPAYKATDHIDHLRATDYKRLDDHQHIYLDYTGGGLYAQSQLDAHFAMLRDGVWGNPHSQNPTSLAMTALVESARAYVLAHFNADPDEYDVIFTANASGALKLVGESYPFQAKSRYLALFDNHNSVNGIREFARSRGADVYYLPTHPPELRIDEAELLAELDKAQTDAYNLFAYPGQSNFTGVQHNLSLIAAAQKRGWHVMLDSAAFAPTNRLDLSAVQPDFVSMSFYKIFGYPTGIGCLIARHEALASLQRPWFAGGTITITSVQGEGWHHLIDGHPAFEDGTVNYLNIPAVEIGLKHIESVGIEHIHNRVLGLTAWLLDNMATLKHDNGQPIVEIYGPKTTEARGGTIAFNLNDPDGHRFDYRRVEQLANQAQISLRTGCFCNPGSGERISQLTPQHMSPFFTSGEKVSFDQLVDTISAEHNIHLSSIRISVGIASNFADVYRFMAFVEGFKNQQAHTINTLPFERSTVADTA